MNPAPPHGRRGSPPPRPDPPALAGRALEALHSLAKGLARARALDPSALPDRLELRVDLDLKRGPSFEGARGLLDQIAARIEWALRAAAALRSGRVYCFFCSSSDCAHAAPPDADSVFDGYEAPGRPRWTDLPTVFLDRRDPRVDTLYGRRHLVTLVEEGPALRSGLIEAFAADARVYEILGQVVAGFFEVPSGNGRREGSAATFQVVRTATGEGRSRLRLNAVSGGALFDERGASVDPSLGRILDIARRRLASLERELAGARRRGGADPDPTPKALSILRALSRDLEHHERAGARRTGHGRERSDAGHRPTALAFPEAREAAVDRIYADDRGETLVVLGKAGRAHVFTADGRHVTSVVLRGDEVARRIRTRRWKPASPEAIALFRTGIGRG